VGVNQGHGANQCQVDLEDRRLAARAVQPNQYGDVILPFTILRRLDAILAPTKEQVLAEYEKAQSMGIDPAVLVTSKFALPFYNSSRWDFLVVDAITSARPGYRIHHI
jgi:type I restriction-modification system DNA methylase subunit